MCGISFVEFAENYLGIELLDWQKEYMTKMYDIYKKNGNTFPEQTITPRRGGNNGMLIGMTSSILMYDEFINNKKED